MNWPDAVGISFRNDFGHWHPDYDHKPEACNKRVKERVKDMDFAISLCKKFEVAVQAGGHLGYWPARLAKNFDYVYTFECEPKLFECMRRNVGADETIIMSPKGLGASPSTAMLLPHVSAGSWRVDPEGTWPIELTTIDVLDLPACNAIFLDVEGYEVEALIGGRATIERFRPIIHVEELPRSKGHIRNHLANIGYRLVKTIHADAVYAPR